MEYSFVHFAGSLWTAEGSRQPDWALWHASLPMHPTDPRTPVVLMASEGVSTTICAFDLASVLLQQQPSFANDDESSHEDTAPPIDDDREENEATLKPRPMGSVAALTTGLRARIESPDTNALARAALEGLLAGYDITDWVSIDFDERSRRPWVLSANNPPRNFKQKAKTYAKEATAIHNAELLVEELRYSHAALALRIPRKQVRLRRSGERNFTAVELLLLANAVGVPPTSLVA
jgi:hypothetical protein